MRPRRDWFTLAEVARDLGVPLRTLYKAVDLNATSPLEQLMMGILVNPDDQPSHQITKVDIIDLVDDDDKPRGPTPPALK